MSICPLHSTKKKKKMESNLKFLNGIFLHLRKLCFVCFSYFAIKFYLFILLKFVEDEKTRSSGEDEFEKKTRKRKPTIKYHKFIELLRYLSTPISALPEFTSCTSLVRCGAWHTTTPTNYYIFRIRNLSNGKAKWKQKIDFNNLKIYNNRNK